MDPMKLLSGGQPITNQPQTSVHTPQKKKKVTIVSRFLNSLNPRKKNK